ncbi:hypothetical protein KC19_VG068800 [Ceratodon purpureus]|uniref:Uncharacterized protein n=1 Tax=Ceratodon purpureus TaxID=3225 RepID=A0A8T0HMR1_CERPU|nr:hypothetical protein KC19_VG068800 [Ceratodon purpureus]
MGPIDVPLNLCTYASLASPFFLNSRAPPPWNTNSRFPDSGEASMLVELVGSIWSSVSTTSPLDGKLSYKPTLGGEKEINLVYLTVCHYPHIP